MKRIVGFSLACKGKRYAELDSAFQLDYYHIKIEDDNLGFNHILNIGLKPFYSL
jgi:hypothetical protein